MGFKTAKARAIAAFRGGHWDVEARGAIDEKNLLATGEKSAADAIACLRRCRADQYSENLHHFDRTITVHIFKPEDDDGRWYIKVYFLRDVGMFVSFHKAGR